MQEKVFQKVFYESLQKQKWLKNFWNKFSHLINLSAKFDQIDQKLKVK